MRRIDIISAGGSSHLPYPAGGFQECFNFAYRDAITYPTSDLFDASYVLLHQRVGVRLHCAVVLTNRSGVARPESDRIIWNVQQHHQCCNKRQFLLAVTNLRRLYTTWIILCTIYAKIVQSINKISAKLDETLFLMWIKFKRNVFIFTMIYWNHVKECAENYFFSGHAMGKGYHSI